MGFSAVAAVGGMMASQMLMSPRIAMPTPAAPSAPPQSQAAKAPSVQNTQAGMAGQGQAGGAAGVAQTMLTGGGGVDQNSLTLGKKTLLGM